MGKSGESFLEEFGGRFGSSKEAENAIEFIKNGAPRDKSSDCVSRGIEAAQLLLDMHMGKTAVVSALLHAIPLDEKTIKAAEEKFGKNVAEILDLKERFEKSFSFGAKDTAESKKKLLAGLSTNIDAVIIQFAEELVKLRNIGEIEKSERDWFLSKIKEVYSPLAHKLGVYQISSEMNDLVFKFEEPKNYEETRKKIRKTLKEMDEDIRETKKALEESLKKAGIEAKVSGRIKSLYSTHEKMRRKKLKIYGVHDLIALRAIMATEKECYEALGVIHGKWKPIGGEFDDYIAKPKLNGYRSLHTTIRSAKGNAIEIQIRTQEMHDFAEKGVAAAHWEYKGEKKDARHDKKTEWIREILEWQKETGEKTEADIFGKEVFALTPKGQSIELPEGASVIDFAYAVHSEVGNSCANAKINSRLVPLSTKIRNGDIVEIITSPKQTPKMGWLGFAKTPKARQKIRAKLQIHGLKTAGHENKIPAYTIKTSDRKIKFAKCCSPVPGDELMGFKTTKRKISVHRADCPETSKIKGERIAVEWHGKKTAYLAEITIEAKDRAGLLKDLLNVVSAQKLELKSANASVTSGNNVKCVFSIKVMDGKQLERLRQGLAKVRGVEKVAR